MHAQHSTKSVRSSAFAPPSLDSTRQRLCASWSMAVLSNCIHDGQESSFA